MIERRKAKEVRIRDVVIGGDKPIAIQSMTNVSSRDEDALVFDYSSHSNSYGSSSDSSSKDKGQINRLEEAGCEIVRIAIPDMESAETLAKVRKKTDMPLVADIHFDYRLAIEAIKSGADKIRINPGNIGDTDRVKAVVKEAKAADIPIRVGVNSGSLEKDILEKYQGVTGEGLAESALRNLRLIEDMGYDNLVVSLKSSDPVMNYEAHVALAEKTIHPIHIGITEAGTITKGKTKSAIGIGSLLLRGIGDTLRVSLTGDPVEEVLYAKEILETIGIRTPKFNLVSCPTCGRTEIDLIGLASEVERALDRMEGSFRPGIKVAVMGCVVNGPGEAKEADYGVAGGKGKGLIIAKGEIVKTVEEREIVSELISLISEREKI